MRRLVEPVPQVALDPIGECNDRTFGVDFLHRTGDDRTLLVGGEEARDRILVELLDTQRDALALRVHREYNRLELVALLVAAQGLLAGVNPVFGLYGAMWGTFTGALFTSSAFMAVQTTGAMSIIVADVDLGAGDGTLARAPGVAIQNSDVVYQFDTDPALSPAEQALNDGRYSEARRNAKHAKVKALDALKAAAQKGENIMPASIACAKAGVTTGEWAEQMRSVHGEYRGPTGVSPSRPGRWTPAGVRSGCRWGSRPGVAP